MRNIAIMLRGHIRNSLDNEILKNKIILLSENYNIDIYIQTWNKIEATTSWRKLKVNDTLVTNDMINNYFGEDISKYIKHIMILNENNLILNGYTEGNICSTCMPILNWKYYWRGKYMLTKYVYDQNIIYDGIINIRFDLFNHEMSICNLNIDDQNLLAQIEYFFTTNKFLFFIKEYPVCVDNIYISSINDMYALHTKFNFKLDTILTQYPTIIYQESIFYFETKNIANFFDYIIFGANISGLILAEQIAETLNKKVLILEQKSHIGQKYYDYIDENTKLLISNYGYNVLHTHNNIVWNYINKFSDWVRYEHKIATNYNNKNYILPINLESLNLYQGLNLDSISELDINSDDFYNSNIGLELYNNLLEPYTKKLFNNNTNNLYNFKNNFDSRYYIDKYQALPIKGYTHFLNNIIKNPNISYKLSCNYNDFSDKYNLNFLDGIICTDRIDQYFNYIFGEIEYKYYNYEIKEIKNQNFYQNFPEIYITDSESKYTKILEFKHFNNQICKDTIISKEFIDDEGIIPCYINNNKNNLLINKYKKIAKDNKKLFFCGELPNNVNLELDEIILKTLIFFENNFK